MGFESNRVLASIMFKQVKSPTGSPRRDLSFLRVMQTGFDPDSTYSFQFAFDGSPSAVQLVRDLSIRGTLKLEQHDHFHRFFRKGVQQLGTAF